MKCAKNKNLTNILGTGEFQYTNFVYQKKNMKNLVINKNF